MVTTIDKEKQAFLMEIMEVEKEMNSNASQVRAYENEIFSLKRTMKKNELTVKEVEAVKEGRSIYVPLGKAFISRTNEQIRKSLLSQNAKHEQQVKECEKSRQYYQEKRKEKEQMVKEGLDRIMKKQEPAKK